MSDTRIAVRTEGEMEIFEGQDIRVFARLVDANPGDLVITFTGRAANPPVEKGFGETYLLKRGISAVHFISKDNHWWQTPEPAIAVEELRKRGLVGGDRKITLYGSSMGGYAALILSRLIRPRRIVVFSPQYSIDGRRVPFERRWRAYAAKLRFDHDDMASGIDHDAELKVVYDPYFLPDRQHVKLIEEHRRVDHVPVPFAGHNTARALEELGIITRVINDLLFADFEGHRFRPLYRRTRSRSSLFWYGLSQTLARHNHHAAAVLASYAAARIMIASGRMKDPLLRRDILHTAIEMACAADMVDVASDWLAHLRKLDTSGMHLALCTALVERAKGNWTNADQNADKVLDRGRGGASPVAIKIEAMGKLAGPAAAIEYHQALSPSLKRAPAVLLAYAGIRAENQEWTAALDILKRYFRHQPRDPAARLLGAQCSIALERPDAAIKLLSPILKYHFASDRQLEEAALLLATGRTEQHAEKLRARHRRYTKAFQNLKSRIEGIDWADRTFASEAQSA